jgi:hypothetical protein
MICALCSKSKGKHQAFTFNCPTEGGFNRSVYRPMVEDLTSEMITWPAERLEKEVARRVIKQIEATLGIFDLQGPSMYSRQSIIEQLATLKIAYNI